MINIVYKSQYFNILNCNNDLGEIYSRKLLTYLYFIIHSTNCTIPLFKSSSQQCVTAHLTMPFDTSIVMSRIWTMSKCNCFLPPACPLLVEISMFTKSFDHEITSILYLSNDHSLKHGFVDTIKGSIIFFIGVKIRSIYFALQIFLSIRMASIVPGELKRLYTTTAISATDPFSRSSC